MNGTSDADLLSKPNWNIGPLLRSENWRHRMGIANSVALLFVSVSQLLAYRTLSCEANNSP